MEETICWVEKNQQPELPNPYKYSPGAELEVLGTLMNSKESSMLP